MQGADLVGHHARDPLQGCEPLLVARGAVGGEQDVPHIPVSSQDLGGAVGEGLAEGRTGLQHLALVAAEARGGADGDALDGRTGLHGQAVAHGVDGHLAHGSLAGPNGGDGVHSTPEVDPADEVSPVHGDELPEGGGVLVVGGGEILQGDFKLFTQRGAGVKTEAAGGTDQQFTPPDWEVPRPPTTDPTEASVTTENSIMGLLTLAITAASTTSVQLASVSIR